MSSTRPTPALRRAAAVALSAGLVTAGSLAAASSASAATGTVGSASSSSAHTGAGHAVFVLSDDTAGNSVIAFSRAAGGTLIRQRTFTTGGLGARITGAAVDPLASQSGLTYDQAHGLLYAVNAGSNSLSVFAVRGTFLKLLQVVPSGGSLPVSVSVQGDLVYVVNAGDAGSVAGFRIVGRHLRPIDRSVRSLGLPNVGNPNFLQTPAQVAITPDAKHLLVTTKKNATVLVWTLDRFGRPSANPTVNTVGGVPFAIAFDSRGTILLANAAGTLGSYAIGHDGVLTTVSAPVADSQAATCWLTTAGRYAYTANAGSGTISSFTVGADGAISLLAAGGVAATTGPGPIDLVADGGTLYVENGGDGSLSSFGVGADGSLAPEHTVTGLTAPTGTGVEGIVAF